LPALPVDFARSSRPFDSNKDCADTVFKPLAKDALVGMYFPNETPPSGATIGPVSQGWRPGDPLAGPYTGRAFTDLNNTTDIVNRIWCKKDTTQITDWGQLTDLAQPVGAGASIGAPIKIWGVQTSSGTYSVWNTFVNCSDSNTNVPQAHIIQENNVPQIRNVTATEFPTDPVAQYNQINQSLYFMSYGVNQSTPFAAGNAVATSINGVGVTSSKIAQNAVATVRTLYNVYRTSTLRASTAGFLNWIHNNDPGTHPNHGTDLTNGKNYFTEIGNTVGTQFGFVQVFDAAIPTADIHDTTT
jgi:hypothetical protein